MEQDICRANIIHPERVAAARQAMGTQTELAKLVELFRLLGEGSRLRLIQALAVTEMCVCDLATVLAATPSAVSHQLRLLRAAGLVAFRKEGKVVFYSLVNPGLASVLAAGTRLARQDGD